uniref:Uncharacterized protein n=1 Tax=Romanomermis culicivorax TaxID=13658 RepID=A0A915KG67_ROMCU
MQGAQASKMTKKISYILLKYRLSCDLLFNSSEDQDRYWPTPVGIGIPAELYIPNANLLIIGKNCSSNMALECFSEICRNDSTALSRTTVSSTVAKFSKGAYGTERMTERKFYIRHELDLFQIIPIGNERVLDRRPTGKLVIKNQSFQDSKYI